MPVTAVIAGGTERPGCTRVASSPRTSPPRALTMPTSVIRSSSARNPVVSRSRTAKVTSCKGVERSSKLS